MHDHVFSADLLEAMGAMTQSDLADLTGLQQSTISRLLDGTFKPSYRTSIILEKALPRLRELRLKATA